ncbi:zf-HC2 domain-containing protein [Janibacter sp. LM]|uniref:anti-sigma factor family protein n=1 Tax=Janibacter TaxID=53457 RepID=UPI0031F6A124
MTCEYARCDGAYVLGALSPSERQEFEQHLTRCDDCSRSVRELAGVPGLLAQVGPGDLLPVPPVPRTLLPRLVADVRHQQRRRTVVVAGLAASVAALTVSAAGLGMAALGDGAAPDPGVAVPPVATSPVPSLPMTAVGRVPVEADLQLESVAWGTRIEVTCTYEQEAGHTLAYEPEYALVVRREGGATERVATWRGLPGRTMHLSAATATGRGDIESVEMRSEDGTTLLRLTI